MSRFDNWNTEDIEVLGGAVAHYLRVLGEDTDDINNQVQICVLLDIMNDLSNRVSDSIAALKADLDQIHSEINEDHLGDGMTLEEFLDTFN